jgi:hypothetical protein
MWQDNAKYHVRVDSLLSFSRWLVGMGLRCEGRVQANAKVFYCFKLLSVHHRGRQRGRCVLLCVAVWRCGRVRYGF